MSATTESDHPPKLTRYQLPGFGLPLNFTPHDKFTSFEYNPTTHGTESTFHPAEGDCGPLYPNALDSISQLSLTTLREFTMMQLMNQLTDKPDWDTKIFDETIVAKWKAEALSALAVDITESMFTWCIDEIRYKSKEFQETGVISVYDGDIVKSDVVIPSSLRHALKASVAPLEDLPEESCDWHPGSDGTVLDLVHPSLFPVVYGRTRILRNTLVGLDDCVDKCGEGETLGVPPAEVLMHYSRLGGPWSDPYSRKFQWLPCEVGFESDKIKIKTYINNLHPKTHGPLYKVIERIIELAIPLWNTTLTPLKPRNYTLPRIKYDGCSYDPDPENFPEEEQPQQLPNETEDEFLDRTEQWVRDTRRVIRPEPGCFEPPRAQNKVDLKREYGDRGLQIIVKLANIHLTPEKPNYGGGTWHVEGQLNEHICATALYYYDNANITESRISFRQQSSTDTMDIGYEQDQHDWLPEIFGCEQNGPSVQYVGDIVAKEGRLLTFPNVFQHRVLPFELLDKSKVGHRKILALFLVDPHIRIISSANVPCQQREWWGQEIVERGLIPTLPGEIVNEVIRAVTDFPMGIEEAKELRLELMEERKGFAKVQDKKYASAIFALCEH